MKQTVFLSHSSKDKVFITSLKELIKQKTSNTINLFQSSDGESIPFGRNWVHKVEDGLNEAKIMFVFISQNSLKSNWIYFESGFSYSKGIKVIPIGILGVDIGMLQPPMSLLQGFNLKNCEGLNNIIAILNSEFETSFLTDITESEYARIESSIDTFGGNQYHSLKLIDRIETFFSNTTGNVLVNNSIDLFLEYLKEKKIANVHSQNNRVISLYGMEVYTNKGGAGKKDEMSFAIDFIKFKENMQIITNFLPRAYEKPMEVFWFFVYFNPNIELVVANYKLSGRLNRIGIIMSDVNANLYEYKNLLFALDDKNTSSSHQRDQKQKLRIVFNPDNFSIDDVLELIDILFENKLIYEK